MNLLKIFTCLYNIYEFVCVKICWGRQKRPLKRNVRLMCLKHDDVICSHSIIFRIISYKRDNRKLFYIFFRENKVSYSLWKKYNMKFLFLSKRSWAKDPFLLGFKTFTTTDFLKERNNWCMNSPRLG